MTSLSFGGFEKAFRSKGFSVERGAGFIRLVKAHCEVHVSVIPDGWALRIPVVRKAMGESFPERLLTYLDERNASPKGPGRFVVEGDFIWCCCEVPVCEVPAAAEPRDVASTAAGLVAQVEKLGPKILNLK